MKKVNWLDLLLSIVVGLALGGVAAFVAYHAKMPEKAIGPLTGAIVGAGVQGIYMMRARQRAERKTDGSSTDGA